MGDGRIVMVLDIQGLLDIAQKLTMKDMAMAALDAYVKHNASAVSATQNFNREVLALAGHGNRKNGRKTENMENTEARSREQAVLDERRKVAEEMMNAMDVEAVSTQDVLTDFGGGDESEEQPESVPVPEEDSVPVEESVAEVEEEDVSVGEEDRSVSQALADFEKEKEQRILRAQGLVAKSDEGVRSELTEENLGKLYGVINTGMINAGLVLSQLLGVQVDVSVPEVKAVEYRELMEYIPAGVVIGVHMDTTGDFLGTLLLLFDEPTGYRAAGDLMGIPSEEWEKGNILEEDLDKKDGHSSIVISKTLV